MVGDFYQDPATLEAMLDFSGDQYYALGVQGMTPLDDYPQVGSCFGHGGYGIGSSASSRYCPDLDMTVTIFHSSDGSRIDVDPQLLRPIYGAVL